MILLFKRRDAKETEVLPSERGKKKSLKISISITAPQFIVFIPLQLVSFPNSVTLIPPYWSVSCEGNEKVVCSFLHFTLLVPQDMMWRLLYGSFVVDNDSCLVLSEVCNKIGGAESLVMLLQRIDNALETLMNLSLNWPTMENSCNLTSLYKRVN